MYIDDGANTTPAAPEHIAISGDGVNWDFIPKAGLKVTGHYATQVGQYKYPVKTILALESAHVGLMMIELQDVLNQPTWSTGTEAGLVQAKLDIASW